VKRTTLGTRLFATIGLTLVVMLAIGALFTESRIRSFHREELERRLEAVARLLSHRFSDRLGPTRDDDLDVRVRDLDLQGGIRVTVIHPGGTVVADSAAALPLDNHGTRPEVAEARRAGSGSSERHSASVDMRLLYVALRVDGPSGPVAYLRTSAPVARAEEEIAALRRALGLGAVVVLLVGIGLSAFTSRWLARPLEKMERDVAAISRGETEQPIIVDGPKEVFRVAESVNRMSEDLRRRVRNERRARQELEVVVGSVAEGVLSLDRKERIVTMNPGAAKLLGLPRPLGAGEELRKRLRYPALEGIVQDVLAGKGPETTDISGPEDNGNILEVTGVPLGHAAGAVILLRDVTATRRLERMRMDFVANVSHELRTPLAGVMGAIETLTDDDDPEVKERFLALADRNARRLQALVSDLLDLSSIEAEQGSMALESLSIAAPLRTAVGTLGDLANRRDIPLVLEPLEDTDLVVEGHSRRLEQAFLNLVENALKYSPEGGEVRVRAIARGDDVVVEVQDSGIGIPPAAVPRLFERFYRVDKSRSREMGGTGLGLAIVKHVVRAHNGSVDVDSVQGSGSTFRVTLPRVDSPSS
jgi:two-component system phosphate regulon sensor histidine kinase PhoR